MVAGADDDLVRMAVRDSVMHLCARLGEKPAQCWAVAFRRMIHCIAPHCTAHVDSLDVFPAETVLSAYDEHWSAHTLAWGDWRTLTYDAQPLRDIPAARSSGFKVATCRHLFCTDTIEKGLGFVDHLHTS